jgi:hypothetical protein
MWSDFFGVLCSLLSSLLVAMGVSLQKAFKLHGQQNISGFLTETPVLMRLGVIFVIAGMALRLPVFLFLPLTTISILSSLTASLSVLIDKRLLQEQPMTRASYSSTVLICIGSILIIFVAELHVEETGVVERFVSRLVAIEGLSLALLVGLFFVLYFQFQHNFSLSADYSLYVLSALSGLWAALFSLFLKLTCIAWVGLVSHRSASLWLTTLLLTTATVVCLFLKIRTVRESIQLFEAKLFTPTYQVASIVLTIVLGVVYLEDLHNFGVTAWLAVVAATVSVSGGILLQGYHEDYEELNSDETEGMYNVIIKTIDDSIDGFFLCFVHLEFINSEFVEDDNSLPVRSAEV